MPLDGRSSGHWRRAQGELFFLAGGACRGVGSAPSAGRDGSGIGPARAFRRNNGILAGSPAGLLGGAGAGVFGKGSARSADDRDAVPSAARGRGPAAAGHLEEPTILGLMVGVFAVSSGWRRVSGRFARIGERRSGCASGFGCHAGASCLSSQASRFML